MNQNSISRKAKRMLSERDKALQEDGAFGHSIGSMTVYTAPKGPHKEPTARPTTRNTANGSPMLSDDL